MRCPKCHYITFDSDDRCRNCGYEFSLTVDTSAIDLPIQTGDEATGPLADLQLSDVHSGEQSRGSALPHSPAMDRAGAAHQPPPLPTSGLDLPLFSDADADDDRPLVAPPAVPRPPLAVRRGSPPMARPAPRGVPGTEEPVLALDPSDDQLPGPHEVRTPGLVAYAAESPTAAPEYVSASLVRRSLAGAIDAVIILGIDAAILYFTLQFCGLGLAEITLLPAVPFLTFVLLLNGGYFASFVAAGGQTIGKMAAGVRVIPNASEESVRVPFGHAVLRAAAYLVSVLPAGLGFLPALVSADRRALHDRLAETRVVRS